MGDSYGALLDDLRCHETSWLRSERDAVVREQRRLKVRELALTKVLDERHALSRMPDGTVSARTQQQTVEVARALESLPAVADRAAEGDVSWEHLEPISRLATPHTDQEWATRGPNVAPVDLNLARRAKAPVTLADAQARCEARVVRTFREPEQGMGGGRWLLPDLDAVLVDKVIDRLAEQMRPEAGQPWAPLDHRKADAMLHVFRSFVDDDSPTNGSSPFTIVVHRREDGSADCDGLDLAAETVDALSLDARIKDQLDDSAGRPVERGRVRRRLPRRVEQHVIERDPHCRVPGCERRRGLQTHHCKPVSWGGRDSIHGLARVCAYHHRMLVPHGKWHLVGDADQIDGLRLVHSDHRTDELAGARAGPDP